MAGAGPAAIAAVCTSAGLDAECVIVEGVNHFSLLEHAVTDGTPPQPVDPRADPRLKPAFPARAP